eukprot:Blabericola_migrator_1__5094@NODE_2635_length_2507_cov_6_290164_g1653_i0_p2_GENE_NODE_2635_length_2507_cov_6_290164_g1653_i0NODE_2635_length_2507_cov_6_290164_g1653_i0_p2_ORF_typecomplete_len210_score38_41_NODE_2635_length_2507_cov_6_290164_g1653_i05781207
MSHTPPVTRAETQPLQALSLADELLVETLQQESDVASEPLLDINATSSSTSSQSSMSLTHEGGEEEPRTRSRIRQRASDWRPILTSLHPSESLSGPQVWGKNIQSSDNTEFLVGEEEKLIHLQYDDVVTAEEVAVIRTTVWKPKGPFPSFNTLEERMDYRNAWDIGYMGTRLVRRADPGSVLSKHSSGRFWDAEFDGTDMGPSTKGIAS